MSQKLVSLNADLSRLRAEGLDVSIGKSKHLLVRGIPHVNAGREVYKKTGDAQQAVAIASHQYLTVPSLRLVSSLSCKATFTIVAILP